MTVLKKPWHFSFRRLSVNHAASRSEKTICGMKPISHMMMVLPKYLGKSLEKTYK